MVKRRAARWAIGVAGASALFVGVVGFLHTPAGKPLLMRVGGCPVGNAPPQEVEAGRVAAVKRTRGEAPAPSRPALGFTLDATTLADVHAWAKDHGIRCTEKREGTLLQCVDVPSRALDGEGGPEGVVADVSFGFTPGARVLTGVSTLRYTKGGAEASAILDAKVSRLEGELGAGRASGARDALDGAPFRTAIVEYRYRDYLADVTGMNLPGRGVAVREHYQSARVD